MGSAIQYHSRRARDFSAWHADVEQEDYFASPFAYGRWRIREALRRLLPAEGAGHHIVDLGSGTGEELALFLQAGYEATGIEPAEGMRAEALVRHPELDGRVLDGIGEDIPLEDGSADIVTAIEVLRYVPDFVRFASEVKRVLKPGGAWVFTVTPPTNWTLGPLLTSLRCSGVPLPYIQPVKQYWHSARYTRDTLAKQGFSIMESQPVNYITLGAMVFYTLTPRLGRPYARLCHRFWAWLERHGLLTWAAGYHVVMARKNEQGSVPADV